MGENYYHGKNKSGRISNTVKRKIKVRHIGLQKGIRALSSAPNFPTLPVADTMHI